MRPRKIHLLASNVDLLDRKSPLRDRISDLVDFIFFVKGRTSDLVGRTESVKCRIDSMQDRGFRLQGRVDLHEGRTVPRIVPLPVLIDPGQSTAHRRPERFCRARLVQQHTPTSCHSQYWFPPRSPLPPYVVARAFARLTRYFIVAPCAQQQVESIVRCCQEHSTAPDETAIVTFVQACL